MHHRICCGNQVFAGNYCGGCNTAFEDIALEMGGGIGIDPMDGQMAAGIPGTDLAVEPDGQLDINLGGMDIPLDDLGW
jgi:hypothetical protein